MLVVRKKIVEYNYLKSILQSFLLKKEKILLGFIEECALHLPFFLCTPLKIVGVNTRTDYSVRGKKKFAHMNH